MICMHSHRLQFIRDGRTLVLAADAEVMIFPWGSQHRAHQIDGVQSIATFDDEVWVATRTGSLRRLGVGGSHDDNPLLIAAAAHLCPASFGPPAAIWTAPEPILLLEDLGQLSATPVPVDPGETVVSVAGRRLVRIAGSRVTLPSGVAVTPVTGAQITDGCAILDGTSLALIGEARGARSLLVLSLASGRTQRSIPLPRGMTRIAARRGLAIVQVDAGRHCELVDLRLGRALGAVVAEGDVVDMAVDPDGESLAFQLDDGELQIVPLGRKGVPIRLPASSTASSRTADDVDGAETTEPDEATAPSYTAPPPPVATERLVMDVPSEVSPTEQAEVDLSVRIDLFEVRRHQALSRADAQAALDRDLQSVSLWAWCAIAKGWDSRRIGYANVGPHPYEHEVAALLGRSTGFAATYLEAAREALAAHDAALAKEPSHRAATTPVGELREEFGLSEPAVDVLLTIAAPSLLGDVARLYGIVANDSARAVVDELLVQTILADRLSRYQVAAELDPRAPLVRLGIIAPVDARPRPFVGLEVDPVVLSRLRGETPDLGETVVRESDRGLAELVLAPGVLASALDRLQRAARPARIAVRGRLGSGRRTLLATLAQQANRALGVIDAARLPRDPEARATALALTLRRAQLAGLVPVVHGLDYVGAGDRGEAELAREVLAAHPGPLAVVVAPTVSPQLPLGHVLIDLPPLSETARLSVWERELGRAGRWLRDPSGLAARYRVGPGVVHRAVARAVAADRDPLAPCDHDIEEFLRQTRDARLADQADRVERLARWSDLVLPPDVLDSLREFIGRVRHRKTVFETWGLDRTMSTSRGLTALFQGQPGTGKTLVAGVIARELGLDLYRVDLAKTVSKWIGETERNLAKVFDAAEDGQAILLFDEADSLFAKRTEVKSSNDRYANLEVNYLLQRLDAFEGIAILTTNSGGSIDPAFKRRLSFRLSFPFPDEETRIALWAAHLPPSLPRGEELTFAGLAHKYQLSGGYIRNACLRAAFLAAQEETTLHQHHLERAVALELAEMGKLSSSGTLA